MAKATPPAASSTTVWTGQNVVILLTLLISLSGGIPGIINLIDYFKRPPNLLFTYHGLPIGDSEDRIHPETGVTVVGDIINQGKEPFYPRQWKLEFAMKDGSVLHMMPHVLFKGMHGSGHGTAFKLDSTAKDFTEVGVIAPGERIYGNISFVTSEMKGDDIYANKTSTTLTCIGQDGKAFPFEMKKQPLVEPGEHEIVYPNTGMSVSKDSTQ